MKRLLLMVSLVGTMAPVAAAEGFQFKDGDRVVLIGGTLIEREQRYGYWETALTCRHPDKNLTFRNLGWSGDTVWGESRAGFDSPAVGYKRLIEHTLSLKPTVIIVGYGTNESFAGEEGLPAFQKQLDQLLDDLTPSKARILLLAPPLIDRPRWPGGNADERDRVLKLYGDALKKTAERRRLWFVPEFLQSHSPAYPLTDNGMHLTAFGYWWSLHGLLPERKPPPARGHGTIELVGQAPVRVRRDFLPNPQVPPEPGVKDFQADSILIARDLKAGKYTLKIDGRAVHTADAAEWMKPEPFGVVLLKSGPSLEQAEKLRQLIVEKNQLYFHRWRPQNETYLFGFRKHEQGKNAKEIPEFDALIEKLEKEIAKLRVPVEHTYELVPAKEEKK